MSKIVHIKGNVVFKDGTPVKGATIKVWEVDNQKNNPDDLIVSGKTDAHGFFSGSGAWKDGKVIDIKPVFRMELKYKGQVIEKKGIQSTGFFKQVKTNWLSPAATQSKKQDAYVTISGRLVYKDKSPIKGAVVKVYDKDPGAKQDDLLISKTTNADGRFSGTGKWADEKGELASGLFAKKKPGPFTMEVSFQGQKKTFPNILSVKAFEKDFKLPWLSPAQKAAKLEKEMIEITGRLLYKNGQPVEGARARIWESDGAEKGNLDDLIVDCITGPDGYFQGKARGRDGKFLEIPMFRYEFTHADLVFEGRGKTKSFFNRVKTNWEATATWSNWLDQAKAKTKNDYVKLPADRTGVQEAMEFALENRLKIKVVGSGHSHSNAAQSADNGVIIDLKHLSGEMKPYEWLKRGKSNLVRVKSGTLVRTLHSQILARKDKGLINMGTFDGQTVAGAVNTNTHGNGIALPGFADMVKSVEMFVVKPSTSGKHSVELWIVEPGKGISDPQAFHSRDRSVHLIQDDDVFHSAVCGYGLFGVAVSYTLKVRDLYWQEESAKRLTWSQLKKEFKATKSGIPAVLKADAAKPVQKKLYIHTLQCVQDGGIRSGTACKLETLKEVPRQLKPKNYESKYKGKINIHKIWPPMRTRDSVFTTVVKGLTKETFNIVPKGIGTKVKLLDNNFFSKKDDAPFFHGFKRSAYYRVIRRLRDNTLSAHSSLESDVYDNTVTTEAPVTTDFGYSMEFAVPVAETIDAIEIAMNEVGKSGLNWMIPTGVRFTAASKHFLSPTYKMDAAYIEITGYLPSQKSRAKDYPSLIAKYRHVFRQIISKLEKSDNVSQVRMHMGKSNNYDIDRLRDQYAKFETWLNVYQHLNATGVFDCPNAKNWNLNRGQLEGLPVGAVRRNMEAWKSAPQTKLAKPTPITSARSARQRARQRNRVRVRRGGLRRRSA